MGVMISLCFPGQSTVLTPYGPKPMRDLAVGDTVRVVTPEGRVEWSQTCGWLHRDPAQTAEYLRLTTSRRQITISATHLIAVLREGKVEFLPAGGVQVGSVLLECDTNLTTASVWGNPVVKVETVSAEGVYAPLTLSGTVVVDGVAASCYADTKTHRGAHAAMKPMRHRWRHNPEKMAQTNNKSKHIPGSHRYVDVLAHVTRRA